MLIYAQPRPVSNGSRSFVPFIMAQFPYETLDNMASNGTSAWSVLRPVVTSLSGPEHWQYGFDDIGNEGSYMNDSNRDYHSESFETYSSGIQPGPANSLGAITEGVEYRRQMHSRQQEPDSSYQPSRVQPSGVETIAPMLRGHPTEWMADNIPPSYSRYSRGHSPPSMFSYSDHGSSEIGNLMPAISGTFETSFHLSNSLFQNEQVESVRLGSNPFYSNSFSAEPANSDLKAMSFNSLPIWPDMMVATNHVQNSNSTLAFTSDSNNGERPTLWSTTSEPQLNWQQNTQLEGTISPQVLSLNLSSSVSSPSPSLSPSRSLPLPKAPEAHTSLPSSKGVQSLRPLGDTQQQPMRALRPRQKLPSEPLYSSHGALHPSIDRRRRAEKKRSFADQRSQGQGIKKDGPSSLGKKKHQVGGSGANHAENPQTAISDGHQSSKQGTSKQRTLVPRMIEPKPIRGHMPASAAAQSEIHGLTHCWDAKDNFLVKSKLSGMSYKEIRRVGGFIEAESTLRGRFRTLTKKKNERVRKPEWEGNDIRLLEQAVRKLAKDIESSPPKVPWKQVADYIFDHGGSYRFGNATCRKRWDELHPN